jgi:hypothetical protein
LAIFSVACNLQISCAAFIVNVATFQVFFLKKNWKNILFLQLQLTGSTSEKNDLQKKINKKSRR